MESLNGWDIEDEYGRPVTGSELCDVILNRSTGNPGGLRTNKGAQVAEFATYVILDRDPRDVDAWF
jgi:hypothetical protein